MAGSKKWFLYETDLDGTVFAIELDESNTELAGAGVDYPNGGGVLYSLPGNVKPRYARYASADTFTVRNCVLCAPATAPNPTIADPVSGQTLNLVAVVAEQVRVPRGEDTGLIDGDAT